MHGGWQQVTLTADFSIFGKTAVSATGSFLFFLDDWILVLTPSAGNKTWAKKGSSSVFVMWTGKRDQRTGTPWINYACYFQTLKAVKERCNILQVTGILLDIIFTNLNLAVYMASSSSNKELVGKKIMSF